MEAALLPHELIDFVSTNRLGHGWPYQKLAIQSRDSASQQPILSAIWLNCLLISLQKKKAGTLQPFVVQNRLNWNSCFPSDCQPICKGKSGKVKGLALLVQ